MISASTVLPHITDNALAAISAVWRMERRQISTFFTGTSMLPAISPGQCVTIDCGALPLIGDVVVFQRKNTVGVHRVIALNASWLLTWGDANPLPDEPISHEMIIGVVRDVPASTRVIRYAITRMLFARADATADSLTKRVRLGYGVRAAWVESPCVFARKSIRALLRHITPCRTR